MLFGILVHLFSFVTNTGSHLFKDVFNQLIPFTEQALYQPRLQGIGKMLILKNTHYRSGYTDLGFALETKKINYAVEATLKKKLLRFFLGMVGVLGIMGMKALIPVGIYSIGAFVRYALLGFWATGLFPLIGKRVLFADAQ